ncbi:MAG: hypothetical protein GY915_06205, partial [bacterium]|nr:hypothetical protein [bacterium]
LDTLLAHYKSDFPILKGLRPGMTGDEKLLKSAHKCIIERCAPDIHNPPEELQDMGGPAPATRAALEKYLPTFEKIDVDMDALRKKAELSDEEREAEELLKSMGKP